jgi:hypothetical protein
MNRTEVPIASPCAADWSTMTLADRGRFCGACRKVVRELKQMTLAAALPLSTAACMGAAPAMMGSPPVAAPTPSASAPVEQVMMGAAPPMQPPVTPAAETHDR